MKKYLWISLSALLIPCASPVFAQNAFWTFDESNTEIAIPIQCDGQFNETTQTVIMPTVEALYQQGELFLEKDPETQKNAGYCFLSAALQGYEPAQYKVAKMYYEGGILQQDNLAAYKWAFLASLNGNKEAEQLALTLEQYLSTDDIDIATEPIQDKLSGLKEDKEVSLEELTETAKTKAAELAELNEDIDKLLGIKYKAPKIKRYGEPEEEPKKTKKKKTAKKTTEAKLLSNTKNIFDESDEL